MNADETAKSHDNPVGIDRYEPRDIDLQSFFWDGVGDSDRELEFALIKELDRQNEQIELIASENIVSGAVLEAQGSVLTNKYAEAYSGRRYYGGCEYVDLAETLAIERAKRLFGCEYANVQPHSGAQANCAVQFALLDPGDKLLGMSLSAGGHLTRGAKATLSGRWFNAVQYGVRRSDHRLDYDAIDTIAREHEPKVIFAGWSAYPRELDFARFRRIADAVDALLVVDMAHFAGLVATGHHASPFPHAHVVTTTTHKTLRGPRGGMILCNDPDLMKRIDCAVFPGLQGEPLMHVIAAKAMALGEALRPGFRDYIAHVISNAKTLAETLLDGGLDIVTGGTDTHLLLVDLRPLDLTGKVAEDALGRANITCNKNGIPFDSRKPGISSGIRLGSPACTTRGFRAAEFQQIGSWILEVLHAQKRGHKRRSTEASVAAQVKALCAEYPVYRR